MLRGFRDDRPEDELIEKWVGHYRTDDVLVTGAWLPAGEFGAGPMPVATYASLDKTLNAGRELVPLRMITDVTTSASHRRQGLLRRLIEDDLDDAVAKGVPIAALTASEATIYGRWGFGPATFRQGVEVDTTPGFELRSFTDPGRVELIEPIDAWPHVKAVFDTFHAASARLRRVAGALPRHPHRRLQLRERWRRPQAPRGRAPRRRRRGRRLPDLQARREVLRPHRGDGRADPGGAARAVVVPGSDGPDQDGDLQPLPPRRPAASGRSPT